MCEMELLLTKEEYDKAIQAIHKVAEAVSKSEWNYERLKAKREKLFLQAITAYWKSISLRDDYLYPIRLSYSTYEYDCGMLNENLTKELLSLDGVNSNGNEDIRRQRKEQVKRILALQDKITELHKAAMKLSVFYRSCVSQSRYQALLGQESDVPEISIPSSPMNDQHDSEAETPVIRKKSSLKRNKSVHHVNILTPEEYDNRKNEIENKHALPSDLESEILEMEEAELRRMEAEEKRKQEVRDRLEAFRKEQEKEKAREQALHEQMETLRREQEEEEEENEMVDDEGENGDVDEGENGMVDEGENGDVDEGENGMVDEEESGMIEEEEEVESDYHPRYQWLQQGNKLLLILLNVDFDQQSLRCITKPGKKMAKVIIQGYRIVRMKQPRGYYNLFYDATPTYQYIPFTTVIPLPSVAVDLSSPPSAMYYDDEGTLQITYTLAQPKPRKMRPRYQHSNHYNPYRESDYSSYPFYSNRGYADEYHQAYRPQRRHYSSYDSDFPSFGSHWF